MTESTAGENSTINTVFSEYSENSKKRNEISLLEKTPDIKLINIISDLLKDICNENNSIEVNNKNIEINKKIRLFMLKKIPPISIKEFFIRLIKYSKISASTLIFILIYIDRLCQKYKFKINYFNIYKFILAAMVIAVKYNEDDFFSSRFYANLGGISKTEMNNLEYEFISMINFNLYVKEDLFYKYHDLLINDDKYDSNEEEKGKES